MRRIQAVYFDAVGTLLFPDPPAEQVYAAVAERCGLSVTAAEVRQRLRQAFLREEERDRQYGWRVDESRELTRWRTIVRTCFAQAEPEQFEAIFYELYQHFAQPQAWRLATQAAMVLTSLYQRQRFVGIASNYDGRLRRVVAGIPTLAPLRDHLVISAEVGYRKPAAAFFAAVVQQAACPAHQILYVGDDWDNDYQGARHAGLQAVLYRPIISTTDTTILGPSLSPVPAPSASADALIITQLQQVLDHLDE
ncbi:MAG: HAD family hydrolase [Gemmataceae bacterium]|nr:HAD family hydrolase [Gemmataceae bacterium]